MWQMSLSFTGKGSDGFSAENHVAKKGSRRFEDTGFVKVYIWMEIRYTA